MKPFVLEVCAFNIQSCLIAEKAGAARVELCDNPQDGGTTPSYGLIRQAKQKLSIPVFPIIRPRGGNFLYDENDLEIIKSDIEICRELGCEGISVGVALQNGMLDITAMKRIVDWAGDMEVTCHRVFDLVPDPVAALGALIDCGCKRLLTSGQQKTAVEGIPLLAQLVALAKDRIHILVGGGVRAANIEKLKKETGANEFHTAARLAQPDIVPNDHPGVLDVGKEFLTDISELEQMMNIGKIGYNI